MNERERLIEQVLADRHAAEQPLSPRPGCPGVTDLMDVALEQASTAVAERVNRHLADGCDCCERCLAAYRAALQDEDVTELALDGSLLQAVAEGDFTPRTIRPPDDTASSDPWGELEGTRLGRSSQPADHTRLIDRLRRWLPVLFGELKLFDAQPESQVEPFLAVVRERLPIPPSQRFRELLPLWLAEFAGRPAGSVRIDLALVARAAVAVCAGRKEEGESAWATETRRFILAEHPSKPDDLLALNFPDRLKANTALAAYVRDLHREARRAYHDGMELFDLASVA